MGRRQHPEAIGTSRRTGWRWMVVLLVLSLVAAACGNTDGTTDTTAATDTTSDDGETTTTAEPGDNDGAADVPEVEIPEADVNFAVFPCCPDNNIVFVAMRQGFFEDVGINILPEPEGHHFSDFAQITPAMQRGDHDISVHFIQGYLQTLNTFGQDIPPIMFFDIFLGISILKAPDSDARTALEIMEEDGVSFPEAAAEAAAQLEGAELYTPSYGAVQPSQPNVHLSYADLNLNDMEVRFFDDPQIVELGLVPGRIEYAMPLGSGVIIQMIENGWEPVISTGMILENDPDSQHAEDLRNLVGSTGLMAQRSFVEENRDTVLRFLSAVYRAMEVAHDPGVQLDVLQDVADVANATRGTEITAEDVVNIYEIIDPFFLWEDQGPQLWTDEGSGFYVPATLEVQVQDLIDNGTLPDQEYDLEAFLVARDLYLEMEELQQQADGLFDDAESLPEQFQGLVEQARIQYDRYNFLDAVRMLEAALGG